MKALFEFAAFCRFHFFCKFLNCRFCSQFGWSLRLGVWRFLAIVEVTRLRVWWSWSLHSDWLSFRLSSFKKFWGVKLIINQSLLLKTTALELFYIFHHILIDSAKFYKSAKSHLLFRFYSSFFERIWTNLSKEIS